MDTDGCEISPSHSLEDLSLVPVLRIDLATHHQAQPYRFPIPILDPGDPHSCRSSDEPALEGEREMTGGDRFGEGEMEVGGDVGGPWLVFVR